MPENNCYFNLFRSYHYPIILSTIPLTVYIYINVFPSFIFAIFCCYVFIDRTFLSFFIAPFLICIHWSNYNLSVQIFSFFDINICSCPLNFDPTVLIRRVIPLIFFVIFYNYQSCRSLLSTVISSSIYGNLVIVPWISCLDFSFLLYIEPWSWSWFRCWRRCAFSLGVWVPTITTQCTTRVVTEVVVAEEEDGGPVSVSPCLHHFSNIVILAIFLIVAIAIFVIHLLKSFLCFVCSL